MKKSIAATLVFGIYALVLPFTAGAMDAPHYDPGTGGVCITCHTPQLTLGTTSAEAYNNLCLHCHRPGDPAAGVKPITLADAADPFQNHSSNGIARVFQTSHRWNGPDTVPAAGAQPPLLADMNPAGQTGDLRSRTGNGLACVRCHDQHNKGADGMFLRVANDRDQMCLDCHRSRNVASHLLGSHPVAMNYSSAAAANPGSFNRHPVNANSDNPSSDLAARLASTGNRVLCTTCHGVHYSDSRSSTVDGADAFGNLSSGDGYLLRTDLHGAKVLPGEKDRSNICINCHAGKLNHNAGGQNVQCADCHGAHVEYDPNDPTGSKGTNAYLIRRNITRGGVSGAIYFRYTASRKEYTDGAAKGAGVCQRCHDVPPPGTGFAPQEHASTDPRVCNLCHYHNSADSSFSVSLTSQTCNSCHGNAETSAARLSGAHRKHVNDADNIGVNLGCVDCHAKTVSSNTAISNKKNHMNSFKDYSGTRAGGSASYDSTTKICSASYCHSNGKGTQVAPPAWTSGGSLACNGCHGDSAGQDTSGAPNYPNGEPFANGHAIHLGSTVGAICASCHAATVDSANKLLAGNAHLNRKFDIKFPASGSWDTAGKTCSSTACHFSGTPIWGGTIPSNCGACHTLADLSRGHRSHVNVGAAIPGAYSNLTSNRSLADVYDFGCANCHPLANLDHKKGVVMLDLRSSDGAGTVSALRSKNGPDITTAGAPGVAGTGSRGTVGVSLTCDSVYCHSSGVVGGKIVYATTPDWYTGYTGADRCGMCHGNAPVTGAHGRHAVSIHNGIVADINGNLIQDHGDATQATTISCDLCHNKTVLTSGNTNGFACVSCHNGSNASLKPAPDLDRSAHVNGSVEISFKDVRVVSKAQVKPDAFNNYSGIWFRTTYKAGAGSFDTSKLSLANGVWSQDKSCSNIACHNGGTPKWNGTLSCVDCHAAL